MARPEVQSAGRSKCWTSGLPRPRNCAVTISKQAWNLGRRNSKSVIVRLRLRLWSPVHQHPTICSTYGSCSRQDTPHQKWQKIALQEGVPIAFCPLTGVHRAACSIRYEATHGPQKALSTSAVVCWRQGTYHPGKDVQPYILPLLCCQLCTRPSWMVCADSPCMDSVLYRSVLWLWTVSSTLSHSGQAQRCRPRQSGHLSALAVK